MIDDIINNIFKTSFKFFLWLENKLTLLKRTWEPRKVKKIIEAQGGKMRIKENEYHQGLIVEIELPLKENTKT